MQKTDLKYKDRLIYLPIPIVHKMTQAHVVLLLKWELGNESLLYINSGKDLLKGLWIEQSRIYGALRYSLLGTGL